MSGASSQVILAVDDSASMRQMVRYTLEGAGYEVIQASDGVEALDFAKTRGVDLVLTTESGQETKMRGKQAGATGWIVKPFSPEQLLSTIARVL